MKNKTVIIILLVLAVALYAVAVINFCLGDVLGDISDVLRASSDTLMAYALYRFGQVGRMADTTRKAPIGMQEQFTKDGNNVELILSRSQQDNIASVLEQADENTFGGTTYVTGEMINRGLTNYLRCTGRG